MTAAVVKLNEQSEAGIQFEGVLPDGTPLKSRAGATGVPVQGMTVSLGSALASAVLTKQVTLADAMLAIGGGS